MSHNSPNTGRNNPKELNPRLSEPGPWTREKKSQIEEKKNWQVRNQKMGKQNEEWGGGKFQEGG